LICSDTAALCTEYAAPDCILLEPGHFPSLNNHGDSVVLSDVAGFVHDGLHYEGCWGGGKNISLERVSSEGASTARANWSRCVSPEGATPGLENSIHARVGHGKATVSLSPNPFSPDGDGLDDRAVISYQFPFDVANLRVLVYDRAGRIVRKILGGGEVAGKGILLWDGRDDSGRFLPIGIYLVYAEASDLMTRKKLRSKATVVLARSLD
ncbi:MAG: FlgD immunoglobulin-like domain containing protein, partial [bacterium]